MKLVKLRAFGSDKEFYINPDHVVSLWWDANKQATALCTSIDVGDVYPSYVVGTLDEVAASLQS